jgi:DNA-binding winged helix-turn-helix (wHTH) protein
MSIRLTNRPKTRRVESVFDAAAGRNGVTEFLADINGIPVLVRFLVADMSAKVQSDVACIHADPSSLLSAMVEKAVDKMGGSPVKRHDQPRQALATVELISSAEHLSRLPVLSNDTVLRVGPLELDLIDRTAKRGDRRIELRPREFQLLKYMMQRSEELLTRATLLKEVWNYKFVPETNLVDVHMGKLRRKVDGLNEPALIRNVRGVGFVLSSTPLSHCAMPRSDGRAQAWLPSSGSLRPAENILQ